MAAWLDAVLSPLKAAGETVQKAVETRDAVKFGEATAGLYAQIRAAYDAATAIQERESALREENESLKRRLVELEALQARKARYELKELPPGVVICTLKEGMDATGDPQRACHHCYENGKISALQSRGVHNGLETLCCNGCGSELKAGIFQAPKPVQYRKPRSMRRVTDA